MEQTEQKHSKKQTSCRDQRPSQNNKTTDEKSPTKVRYSRSTKKGRKAALAWKKEVISSSFPHKSFFQKARARQKR